MYPQDENIENSRSHGWASNVLLKECGDIWELKEFHEGVYHYGYDRGKKKKQKLGRSSVATEEQKAVNKARSECRRKRAVIDLVNCSEQECRVWFTYTYHREEKNLSTFHRDRISFFKRLERFVQTGKLYGKPIKSFTPASDFQLKAIGVIEFQDGERKENGEGRGVVHGHQVMNTPYIPQVHVITADVYDSSSGTFKQAYLQKDNTWSLVANKETVWFSYLHEATEFLANQTLEDSFHISVNSKRICILALLWQQGYTNVKTIENLRKLRKLSNVGEYMVSKYMVASTYDQRLQGRKAYFFAGNLETPRIYRDTEDVNNHLEALDMWQVLVDQRELIGFYVGAFTVYLFNFWVTVYPWIRNFYLEKAEKRRRRIEEKMGGAEMVKDVVKRR